MNATVINLDSRPDRMISFCRNEIPFPVKRFSAIKAKRGEDGCTMSHLKVLQKQHEFPFIVFEDDCVLVQPWEVVNEALEQLPLDADALWLGANPRKRLEKYSTNLCRLTDAYCLHAVIYKTRRIVDYILQNHNTKEGKNLDIFYRKDVLQKFNCYITYPMVATQLSDHSDIANVVTNNRDELILNYKKFTI